MLTIGYARVSKEEQARDGLSLPDQRQAIERYCELRGMPAPEVLADEGISGTSLSRREKAQRLIAMVEAGEVQHVVATALDRLFRSTLDAVSFFALAKERGVSVHLIREALDTSTPVGEFTATIMAALAQLESRRTGERIRHVLAYKRDANGGRPINGQAPYGWEWAPEDPADPNGPKTLRPHESEQETLQRMRALREQECAFAEVADRLNAAGCCPRRGRAWTTQQVWRVLRR